MFMLTHDQYLWPKTLMFMPTWSPGSLIIQSRIGFYCLFVCCFCFWYRVTYSWLWTWINYVLEADHGPVCLSFTNTELIDLYHNFWLEWSSKYICKSSLLRVLFFLVFMFDGLMWGRYDEVLHCDSGFASLVPDSIQFL